MNIYKEIKEYKPFNKQEEKDKEAILAFIDKNSDAFLRENLTCHITASSMIVNKDYTKVLMIYHNRYDSWSWTGGHADGCEDLLSVAIKEAKEETSIVHIKPVMENIFSLEMLSVDGHEKEGAYVPSHIHANVTYLLEGLESDEIKPCIKENKAVKWIKIDEVTTYSSEKWMNERIYKKLIEKIKAYNKEK